MVWFSGSSWYQSCGLHQTFGQATWDEWVMNWSPHRDIGNPWGHEAWKKHLKRLVVSKESWIFMLHGDTSECSQFETTSQDRMTYQIRLTLFCGKKRTTSQGFKHRSPYWHCRELGCTHFVIKPHGTPRQTAVSRTKNMKGWPPWWYVPNNYIMVLMVL